MLSGFIPNSNAATDPFTMDNSTAMILKDSPNSHAIYAKGINSRNS